MKKNIFHLVLFLFTLVPTSLFAMASGAFSNEAVAARPLGQYNCVTAQADDASAIFFNRRGSRSVYLGLLLFGLVAVSALHSMAVTPTGISRSMVSAEVIIVSILLSFGPFLYAYTVRSRSYFKEHTMAGLTHELKSPLANMEGALEIFEKRIVSKLDHDDTTYLDMMKSNQQRLRGSINNLLEVYHVDGASGLAANDVDMGEVIETICQRWKDPLDLKGIKISVPTPCRAPLIKGDRDKLELAFGNILSNAAKFTDHGHIRINIGTTATHLEVSVLDTGPGIPANELPHIFDRFFQGKTKRNSKGSGIGLTIAKAWVEAHGGKIWAESEGEGKGATVTFTLPA